MDKTLVIMAAGLSSRYHGIKQIERVGPGGEMLMDYAVFDAIRESFNKIVFVLKPDIIDGIRELFDAHLRHLPGVRCEYALQTNDMFTDVRPELASRLKPLGTVHALLCAKEYIDSPFAVINADDFYGMDAFRRISRKLDTFEGAQDAAMAAYRLCNTVSRFGSVTRGICSIRNGYLSGVTETYNICLMSDGSIQSVSADGTASRLDPDAFVSMNMWGFHQDILPRMENYFKEFLASPDNDPNRECLLPIMVDSFMSDGSVRVSAETVSDRWFGLTYREDRENVIKHLEKLCAENLYPPQLWK